MDFKKIGDAYPFKTELHAHTSPVSACGRKTPEELVDIYREAGCDSVVITNHLLRSCCFPDITGDVESYDTEVLEKTYIRRAAKHGSKTALEFYLSAYYEATKAARARGISVILGAELRFIDSPNDYLLYGICPDDIERIMTYIPRGIEAFYNEFIKGSRAILIHAHPFRDGMDPTPLGFVDGIEVFNMMPFHNSRVALAARFAREHGLRVSGGSDFHEEGRQATCLMRTSSRMRDSYDVAEAIRSQDVLFDILGNLVIPKE